MGEQAEEQIVGKFWKDRTIGKASICELHNRQMKREVVGVHAYGLAAPQVEKTTNKKRGTRNVEQAGQDEQDEQDGRSGDLRRPPRASPTAEPCWPRMSKRIGERTLPQRWRSAAPPNR
jgi:hypothetical protein